MSQFIKCDFCGKSLGFNKRYYKFKVRDKWHKDTEIDVCVPCREKFLKSIKTEGLNKKFDES